MELRMLNFLIGFMIVGVTISFLLFLLNPKFVLESQIDVESDKMFIVANKLMSDPSLISEYDGSLRRGVFSEELLDKFTQKDLGWGFSTRYYVEIRDLSSGRGWIFQLEGETLEKINDQLQGSGKRFVIPVNLQRMNGDVSEGVLVISSPAGESLGPST